eukprot:Tbor_TRINITY_DN5988_c2_g1::TRINITY_DN5988_c2_g1_i14::g.19353::m.19353
MGAKKEINILLLTWIAVPAIMVGTKVFRIDARDRHALDMRMKYHSSFWARGNTIVNGISRCVLQQVREGHYYQNIEICWVEENNNNNNLINNNNNNVSNNNNNIEGNGVVVRDSSEGGVSTIDTNNNNNNNNIYIGKQLLQEPKGQSPSSSSLLLSSHIFSIIDLYNIWHKYYGFEVRSGGSSQRKSINNNNINNNN